MGISSCEVTSTQLLKRPADNAGMTIKTTLAALLLSACTVPGLTTGSTFSAGSSSSPTTSAAPAADPVAASPAASHETAAPALQYRDIDNIDDAAELLARLISGEVTPASGTQESTIRNQAMYCSQQVENLLHRDYAASTKLGLDRADVTLGEADAKVCQALAKQADGWTARADAAHAAERDAVLEPYRKLGVAGDKLKLVNDLGKQLIGPGQADPTPAVVAKASVLFSLRHDGFRQWTIVRYAFKSNKQVAITEKGYPDRPGPDQYR